ELTGRWARGRAGRHLRGAVLAPHGTLRARGAVVLRRAGFPVAGLLVLPAPLGGPAAPAPRAGVSLVRGGVDGGQGQDRRGHGPVWRLRPARLHGGRRTRAAADRAGMTAFRGSTSLWPRPLSWAFGPGDRFVGEVFRYIADEALPSLRPGDYRCARCGRA